MNQEIPIFVLIPLVVCIWGLAIGIVFIHAVAQALWRLKMDNIDTHIDIDVEKPCSTCKHEFWQHNRTSLFHECLQADEKGIPCQCWKFQTKVEVGE